MLLTYLSVQILFEKFFIIDLFSGDKKTFEGFLQSYFKREITKQKLEQKKSSVRY